MIFVDRSAVPPPPAFIEAARREREEAARFYAEPPEERRQRRFGFKAYKHPDVREALRALFHYKCAYCESYYGAVQPVSVEHFRPKGGVVLPDGSLLPDHYWWLAMEWSNLYTACVECGRMRSGTGGERLGKGNRFPLVDEATRADPPGGRQTIEGEQPLLLDPCADHPEEQLVFLEDGNVVSDTPRGQATIEIMNLNRPLLIQARQARAMLVTTELQLVQRIATEEHVPEEELADALRRVTAFAAPTEPYAGLARQLVGTLSASLEGVDAPGGVAVSARRRRRAKAAQDRFVAAQEEYSLSDGSGDEVFRSVTRRIERVVLRNVKSIRFADLDLGRSTASSAPWIVLLGENGSGKSTILQALAIGLIGQAEVERLGLDAASFIRRAPNVRSGSIDIYMTGSRRPRRVRFTPNGFEFSHSHEPHALVLGYGETRMLPTPGLAPARGSRACRVEALFHPARSLADAEAWLLDRAVVDDERFDYVGRAMQDLLDLPPRQWLERSDTSVWVRERGRTLSLRELSTGYQSVFATVIDVLEVTLRLWPSPDTAEGIVLLDELGAHLHPTWRMQVVGGLRRMLPGMQFVATTHEPLCLRGLEDHEVVLMQRDADDRANAVTDLPSPRDLRVDQLLTSRHFGLSTTLDPELDKRFQEYYDLLSHDEAVLTSQQRERRDELAGRLQGHGVLGYTRRDQLVYEAIDLFLAQQQKAELERNGVPPNRERTLQRVADLWRFAQLAEEAEGGER